MTFDEIKAAMTPEQAVNILMLWGLQPWVDNAEKEDMNPVIESFSNNSESVIEDLQWLNFCNSSLEEGFILAAAYLQVKEAVDRLNDLEY